MYPKYSLTLMLTHDCNMRCSYCYIGPKSERRMPEATGRRAIDLALDAIEPGGALELGFFGGEPLLEAPLVLLLAEYARLRAAEVGARASFGLTTNGTVESVETCEIMARRDFDIAVSLDGPPDIHDRHRRFRDGGATAERVIATVRRLIEIRDDVRTVSVVRPDTLDGLPRAIEFIRDLGVRQIDLTLDVWADWVPSDAGRLERAVARAARVWARGLPHASVNWFDEKAAALCRLPFRGGLHCGFGQGEITVAPSGNLYPCERLAGDDDESNPMRMPGNVNEGADFQSVSGAPGRCSHPCSECSMGSMCNTYCRCANYVRTGNVSTPDRLLCLWNQTCAREAAAVLRGSRALAAADA